MREAVTDCPDCTQARAQRWWGAYANGCTGCAARAVARSGAAINAGRDPETLDRTIARAMPGLTPDAALQLVREWWQQDHATEEPTT